MPSSLYRTNAGRLHPGRCQVRSTRPRAAPRSQGGREWRADAPPRRRARLGRYTYPSYFHGRLVVLQGTLRRDGPDWWIESAADGRLRAAGVTTAPPDGRVELTGQFLDVGRVSAADPRLADSGVAEAVAQTPGSAWPAPGEMFVLRATLVGPRPTVNRPGVRALALDPDQSAGERVRLQGQFRGRTSDRVLVLRFRHAMAAYRDVVVTLDSGIAAADGTTVAPWRLTFRTGGRAPDAPLPCGS